MDDQTDILIIGGGPGGLACARLLSEHGRKVCLVERKQSVGPKVCAGGITWSGLLQHVPEELIEQSFPDQYIKTSIQHITISETKPIIATVNREKLGKWMKQCAADAGATILTGTRATNISESSVSLKSANGMTRKICFNHLIGADGANSIVRRHLGLGADQVGLGLNAYVPIRRERMEWHLLPKRFGYGYAWIFPHSQTTSVGAFVDRSYCSANELKTNLIEWAGEQGIFLEPDLITGGLINYDYRGHSFGTTHLVGEAAGLASGLTGEGIYPAIISGRAVAKSILTPGIPLPEMESMIKKQKKHHAVIRQAKRAPLISELLMNMLVFMLRIKALDFRMLEMAD